MRKTIIKASDGSVLPNGGKAINPTATKMIGEFADIGNSLFADRNEYNGDAGLLSSSLDTAYDTASDAVKAIPVYGQLISAAMKTNKLMNNVMGKLGAGTDGMTTGDAILGSPFLMPFGIINGAFGKKADTFTKDDQTWSFAGNSYAGSLAAANNAAAKSGKKYGLVSRRQRKKANDEMADAARQQKITKSIVDEAQQQNLIASTMSDTFGNAYLNELNGGYQQGMIHSAKAGGQFSEEMKLRAKQIVKAQKGVLMVTYNWPKYIAKDSQFMKFVSTLPEEWKEYTEEHEDLYDVWRENGKPRTFSESTKDIYNPLFILDDNGKTIINPDISEVGESKQPQNVETLDDFKIEVQKLIDNNQPDFLQKGGQLNLIPEGALHAQKHHIEENREDLDGNITHKGIPVISVSEGGQVEQNAEIERNEIIFNLEVTEQIEELRKKYHNTESQAEKDKIAEEAGKILSDSIMEDTNDKTGLIDSIKE